MKRKFVVTSLALASLLSSCSGSSFKDDVKMFRQDYGGKWVESYYESETSSKKICLMAVTVSNLGEKAYSFYPSEFSVSDNGSTYTCISFLKSKKFHNTQEHPDVIEGYIVETSQEETLEPNTGYGLTLELCFDAALSESAKLTYVNKDTKDTYSI